MLLVINIGKEGPEGVEVFGRVGVVFVIVTLGATDRGSHPDCGYVSHPVGLVDGAVFCLLQTTFVGRLEEAVVAGGHELLSGGIGKEISGQLLPGELVKRHILVESSNDVVAIRGDVVILIAVVTDRVGIADKVEPVDRETFAEVWRVEESIAVPGLF